ncbi:MAG TPA: hypothetical protein VFS43_13065 [Polyangiaceae bacterium]|nr:hypothetical protein [Polyangiaceae bacterium]
MSPPHANGRRPRAPFVPAAAAALASALAALSPRPALAAPPGEGHESLYVLQLADHDALEPAKALSAALRHRVNESKDFALGNSTSSLEALASRCAKAPLVSAAGGFREPSRPCQEQIGTQLRLGALMPKPPYVWGLLYRSPSPPKRLVLRVHLWREGQEDALVEQPYDESLVDPKSPALVDLSDYLLQRLLYGDEIARARVIAPGGLGGELWVDGEAKGRIEPGAPREIALRRGDHAFEVRSGGRVVGSARQALGPGPVTELAIAPAGPPAGGAAPAEAPAEPRPAAAVDAEGGAGASGGSALPWVVGGVGAAALAASGIFFIQERQASNELEDLCARQCPPRAQEDIDRSKLYGLLWPVSLGVGVAGLGAAAYLFLTDDEKPAGAGARARAPSPWRVTGTLHPIAGGAAAGLRGSF